MTSESESTTKPANTNLLDDDSPMFELNFKFCNKEVIITEDFDAGLGGTIFDGSACLANFIEVRVILFLFLLK